MQKMRFLINAGDHRDLLHRLRAYISTTELSTTNDSQHAFLVGTLSAVTSWSIISSSDGYKLKSRCAFGTNSLCCCHNEDNENMSSSFEMGWWYMYVWFFQLSGVSVCLSSLTSSATFTIFYWCIKTNSAQHDVLQTSLCLVKCTQPIHCVICRLWTEA